MQKIVFLLVLVLSGITSFSQQDFFVYLQSDNHQPFYTRIKTRMYSSTENGYMIIPKLGDSTYEFAVGFARNSYPEQSFIVSINRKDKGFQLKNAGEKGWTLVNLQNGAVISNSAAPTKIATEFAGTRKQDAFSEMLASVVNDSAILYTATKPKVQDVPQEKKITEVAKKPENTAPTKDSTKDVAVISQPKTEIAEKKPDSIKKAADVILPDTTRLVTSSNTKPTPPVIINDTSNMITTGQEKKALVEQPFITRIDEKKTAATYQATYLEQYNFSTDTIKISIQLTENAPATIDAAPPVVEKKAEPVPETKTPAEEKIFAPRPVVIDSATAAKKTIQITNSDCKAFATDYDLDKLRVKLISDQAIDDKLTSAKKYFKTKCFSVKQIKALTELFPSDETKYRFFDVCYPYVSDSSNFYLLEALIENNYYKNRFKAMISK